MCNLYRMSRSAAEVAHLFDSEVGQVGNAGGEVYPGYPAMVVTAQDTGRRVEAMHWGFPLVQKSKRTGEPLNPRPVNNTRTDKLSSPFWAASFRARRCLIPLSAWAEAEGAKGAKTRTWMSLPDADLFACAGIWRDTAEWGQAFSMVMTDASAQARAVHDRMPVIMAQDDWQRWLSAPAEEARRLCVPWPGALAVDRTEQTWYVNLEVETLSELRNSS